MTTVYLVCGPRGAGKTTALKKLKKRKPAIKIINRDAIAVYFFNSVYGDGYGSIWGVYGFIQRVLNRAFSRNRERIILDAWAGGASYRRALATMARKAGADRVVCIFFTTPQEKVCEWFWQKPEVMRYPEGHNGWMSVPKGVIPFPETAPIEDYTGHVRQMDRIQTEHWIDEVIFFDPTTQDLADMIEV